MEQFFTAFPGPLPLEVMYGKLGFYLISLVIGIAFGVSLEIGGFGKSTKLAGQFYFTDMTVFKVMFTGIIVAMVLIFGASAFGWLDYGRVFVNTTYLWPGIVGGLIMGVGFVVGGFCPGTSLVALATFKKDGMAFVAGLTVGIFAFGENIDGLFANFWNSSNYGRYTLGDLTGLPIGVIVFAIVAFTIPLFWIVEYVEDQFNNTQLRFNNVKEKQIGAGIILALALLVMVVGQPTTEDKWERIATTEETRLEKREVQIAPAELLQFVENDLVKTVVIDVRDESDYNLFHIHDSKRVELENIATKTKSEYLQASSNTLFVLVSNDESRAIKAWKTMRALSIENVYILEGGVNNWIATFMPLMHHGDHVHHNPTLRTDLTSNDTDILRYEFEAALGSNYDIADPVIHDHEFEFIPKVKMKVKQAAGGG